MAGGANTSMPPSTSAAASTSRLNTCWPGNTKRLSIQPCSLAKAISEPENDTAPISTPSTARVCAAGCMPSAPCTAMRAAATSSTTPMAAAAPPPMPLYRATICGMAVIATRRPVHQAGMPATAMASRISQRCCMPGKANVAPTAISMPTPAQTTPARAVRGELMRLSPRMNSNAARK